MLKSEEDCTATDFRWNPPPIEAADISCIVISNGTWIEKEIDLSTLPIYVKQGATLKYCDADKTLINGYGDIVRSEAWK